MIIGAGRRYKIAPTLLQGLFFKESELNHRALSPKGYKEIAQSRSACLVGQNILNGAETLREKMNISLGDVEKAVSLYKGFWGIKNEHSRKVMLLKREMEGR